MKISTRDPEKKTETELLKEQIVELEQLVADIAILQLGVE